MKTFLTILAICFLVGCDFEESSDYKLDFTPSVSFTGTQFIIRNNNGFDYNNTVLRINSKYSYNAGTLRGGETYTVGMMQFADSKGNRLMPSIKPLTIYISISSQGQKGHQILNFN